MNPSRCCTLIKYKQTLICQGKQQTNLIFSPLGSTVCDVDPAFLGRDVDPAPSDGSKPVIIKHNSSKNVPYPFNSPSIASWRRLQIPCFPSRMVSPQHLSRALLSQNRFLQIHYLWSLCYNTETSCIQRVVVILQ